MEPRAEERGYYTRAKLIAEKLVVDSCRKEKINAVILRPGQIFGGKTPLLTGAVARKFGKKWVVLGNGKITLPLVYIDDAVDAVILAMEKTLNKGEIFHLIDSSTVNQNEVLDMLGINQSKIIRIPRTIVFALGAISQLIFKCIGRKSPFSVYRMRSALPYLSFSTEKAAEKLGWEPQIGIKEGVRRSLMNLSGS